MEPIAEAPTLAGVAALPVALFLSAAITKLVDFLRNAIPGHLEKQKWASILLACIIGIVLALLVNFNIFAAFNVPVSSAPVASVISGMLLAGGAGGIHEFFDLMSSLAKRAKPE